MNNNTQELIPLLEQLIAVPSITPNDAGCQTLIANYLTPLGFQIENLPFNGVDNLWARYGKEAPLFVFLGHTDVVPAGPLKDWTTPPFSPQMRENHLYGRGASDMKGAIAAMLVAVKQWLTTTSFKGSIAFLITSDEEGIAKDGTQKVIEVLQSRGEKIDYCLVGEPSSDQRVGDQIRIGRRGSLHGKLIIHGKQGHVAHPTFAINPIHLSFLALNELLSIAWDQGNEFFPKTTFQITNIHAGTGAANVIPGHLEVLFNFRFGSALTPLMIEQRTEEVLNKYQLNFDIEWQIGAQPFITQGGKLLEATKTAITAIMGSPPHLSTGGGTSDGRFIAPTGAEVIELGVSHHTAHQVDECVNINDLYLLVECYLQLLKLLFR
jgi:succinyl-diaminopimelate desuccinylase